MTSGFDAAIVSCADRRMLLVASTRASIAASRPRAGLARLPARRLCRGAGDLRARRGDRATGSRNSTLPRCCCAAKAVAADPATGVDWLRKAAEAGLAQAQYNLGLLYESGIGVTRSLTAATEWWEKAAEQGHVDAQVQVGTQYFLGRGAPKDWTLAAKWYEAAAENGDVGAQYLIASFYEHGDGVAQDLKRALVWYLQAARQGDAGAALQATDVARRLGAAPPRASSGGSSAPTGTKSPARARRDVRKAEPLRVGQHFRWQLAEPVAASAATTAHRAGPR